MRYYKINYIISYNICSALLDHTFLLFFASSIGGASPPQTPHSQSAFGLPFPILFFPTESPPTSVSHGGVPPYWWCHPSRMVCFMGDPPYGRRNPHRLLSLIGGGRVPPYERRKNVRRGQKKRVFEKSWGWACLVWKMFLHPVGVFCTHLEAPSSHIIKNRNFRFFT